MIKFNKYNDEMYNNSFFKFLFTTVLVYSLLLIMYFTNCRNLFMIPILSIPFIFFMKNGVSFLFHSFRKYFETKRMW